MCRSSDNAIRRPLLTYGLLECGIALSALFVPVGLSLAGRLQVVMFGGNPEPPDAGSLTHVAFCLATSAALIVLPTALMGATLPMLAGFLLGIAIGGGIASRLASSRRIAAIGFVYAQSTAAMLTLMTYHLVDQMMNWPWEEFGGESTTTIQVAASIMGLLPTSICIGLTFPLAIRVYAKDEREAATGAARVYFWNVFGGIVGAFATGVLILPRLQYQGATAVAIFLNILIAAATVFVLRIPVRHAAFAVVALLVLVRGFPPPPENVLRISALDGSLTSGRILFNHVGKSATVTVFDDLGEIRFQTNGLSESALAPQGGGEIDRSSGRWLSALPPLVRPSCRSMLIIGLGGGVAVEEVPSSVKSIDVLELEPAVVDANRVIADQPILPEAVDAEADGQPLCVIDEADRDYYQRLGMLTPTHLFSRLSLDEAGLRQISEGAPRITDERNLLAMQAPLLLRGHDTKAVESYLDQHSPLSRGLDAVMKLCPSFDVRVYLSRQVEFEKQDWVREVGLPLLEDAAQRAVVEAQLQRSSGSTQGWLLALRSNARRFPENSDLAFQVLSNKVLGKIADLPEAEESRIREALSGQHSMVIEMLEQVVAGDLDSARAKDAELARMSVDEVAYEMAVRVRLPWRLEASPAERVARCNEVIQIIDLAAPFANSTGLAFFRVSAGVRARRPDIAVGTVEGLVRAIRMKKSDDSADPIGDAAVLSNLMRCYQLLRDPRLFQGIPAQRYRQTLRAVESVLAEAQSSAAL